MGVAGCGKSTIGEMIARALGAEFIEADAHHPAANIEKMTSGVPLTDADRWPWLDALGAAVPREGRAVVACSALRRVYRERLARAAAEPIYFVHLKGAKSVIAERMKSRAGHFMPPGLIDSQFATLEPLAPDEAGLTLNVRASPRNLIEKALHALREAE